MQGSSAQMRQNGSITSKRSSRESPRRLAIGHFTFVLVKCVVDAVRTARTIGRLVAPFPAMNSGRRDGVVTRGGAATKKAALELAALFEVGGCIRMEAHEVAPVDRTPKLT